MSGIDRRKRTMMERFKDRAYRQAFVTATITQGLAEQIRETRLARGWTQEDLAQKVDSVQGTVSRLEDPDYGRYSLRTLQRLAAAFDVALVVRFEPFSRFIDWSAHMQPSDLAVPDYAQDLAMEYQADHQELVLQASCEHIAHAERPPVLGGDITILRVPINQGPEPRDVAPQPPEGQTVAATYPLPRWPFPVRQPNDEHTSAERVQVSA